MARPKKTPVAETKPAAKTAAPAPSVALVKFKTGAMSTDVGPKVIAAMVASAMEMERSAVIKAGAQRRNFDALAATTLAIVKLVRAEPSIDLTVAYRDDKKAQGNLNNQIGVALGFRVQAETKTGALAFKYAPSVTRVMAPTKEELDGMSEDEQRAAKTVRGNFLTQLKKCAQTAYGIISSKDEVSYDKTAGTLMISGPETKKQFGEDRVLLNGKEIQETYDKKGKPTGVRKELKAKPSFQAIADRAASTHGNKVSTRRIDSRVKQEDPSKYVVNVAKVLIVAIGKLPEKVSAEVQKALESIRNAIDVKIA